MCFFLTVAVPSQHADRGSKVFARGFQVFPTANPSAMAAIPAGYVGSLVTSGMCSCDLYARPQEPVSNSTAHQRRKYEQRGWSEAKIQRALDQVEASKSKARLPDSGLRGDVVRRLQTLCQLAGRVAMFVHWYDGDIETERVLLHHAGSCDCDQLPAKAQVFREDQLLIVVAPARQSTASQG
jgi:hypothetical protein